MMKRCSTLTFKGYKSFYDKTALPLGDLNILIGANQSGKSNLLDLLDLLNQASQRKLQTGLSERGGIDNVLSWESKESLSMHLSMNGEAAPIFELELAKGVYGATITSEKFDGIELHSDSALKQFPTISSGFDERELSAVQLERVGKQGDDGQRFLSLVSFLKNITVHHYFNTTKNSPMRNADFIGAHISGLPPTRLAPNGDNLTSVLYLIAHEPKYRDSLEEIEFTLHRAFSTFKRLTFPPISQGKTIVSWEDTRTTRAVPATFLSDGTLRFMCLLAALYDPEPPSLLCIDEPEAGLHPDMLRLLAAVIQEASERMQIIISTHSADLLTYLESPDSIIVCESENGRSLPKKLDGDELKGWLERYSLGELWKQGELGGLT